MSIAVEHDKRKQEILEKALDVFVQEGYTDTTFQKISDRCGITRTILYLYFKNKREIFIFSLKRFTELLEAEISAIAGDAGIASAAKLHALADIIVNHCATHAKLFSVISDYLSHLRRTGVDPYERVRRRTIRMRHIISGIVIAGQKNGELAKVPVRNVADLFYTVVEAAFFRIAVLNRVESGDLADTIHLLVDRIRLNAD